MSSVEARAHDVPFETWACQLGGVLSGEHDDEIELNRDFAAGLDADVVPGEVFADGLESAGRS